MNEISQERLAFLRKKNEARRKSAALDWEKDKAVSYGNKPGYRYLSIDKMKRNLLPVFMESGLDFKFDYGNIQKSDPIGSMSQHWVLECTATLTDIDTGYSETTVVYGESGDSGDKAIAKASTYALKTWLADTFMLIDGVDPDQGSEASSGKVFIPKTDKEQEEVKSKVFANAVPTPETQAVPATPVTPTAPVTPAVPKPPVPNAVPKPPTPAAPKPIPPQPPTPPVPAPSAPKAEEKPGEAAIRKLKQEKIDSFVPSVPQQNAINNIVARWSEKAQTGEMSNEQYEEFCKDRSEIGNNQEAIAFIKKWKVDE